MLTVHISSFSYAKTGLQPDEWGHGGGFVFDCRLLPNPGRLPDCAPLTGCDEVVIDYLQARPEVGRFLRGVSDLVSLAVAEYQRHGYDHLSVAFGCTGGRHRSVFCAEHLRQELEGGGHTVTMAHTNLNTN